MNAYPKIGSSVWVLIRRGGYAYAVRTVVSDIDWVTGEVVLRWNQIGVETMLRRHPGGFWASREAAEEAAEKIFGRRRRWDETSGEQLRFSRRWPE